MPYGPTKVACESHHCPDLEVLMTEKPSESPADDLTTILGSGGGPAVATGTSREQAEQKPATVQDVASAEVPVVAVPDEE